jgi:hypothetical protein
MSSTSSEIPSYLNTPSRSAVRPPVETRAQDLPFGELAWEDFERLCLRLARLEGDVLHCQLYGTRGQNQEGIDLYARVKGPAAYRVFQCKREDNFGAAKIRKAVTKFLDGEWATKATSLVLCTKESLVETSRATEVESQRTRLEEQGIGLIIWDSEQLTLILKDHPRIVDDFFSRSWVRVFLGEEVASSLGTRLDASDVARFRHKLGMLYARVFGTYDPGLPITLPNPAASLPLHRRYVLTDMIEYRQKGRESTPEDPEIDSLEDPVPSDSPFERKDRPRRAMSQPDEQLPERVPLESWIGDGTNFLVLGGPGSGKSSLLRYLAIDLLNEAPQLASAAAKWGENLPVWVSFPYWTRLIVSEGQEVCSLSKLLKLWLRSLDEERLWPLVERALEDDRLLLLIDGLDEWSSERAARIAFQRLQVFVEQRRPPSLAASRPHGMERLGVRPPGWRIGTLAPFNREQQARLATTWFLFRETGQADTTQADPDAGRRAENTTSLLFSELERSREIQPLAQNPLLLTLLIYHRFQNARLPRTRFSAYGSLIEHLIEVHPERRRAAAQEVSYGDELSPNDLLQVLARLAYRIHRDAGEGLIAIEEAIRTVEEHLRDTERGLGLDLATSRRLARRIVDLGEVNLGILVRQSPLDVGFIHRSFQEYLAGIHLSLMPPDVQAEELERCATDPRWREVLLALLHATGRQHAVQEIVGALRRKKDAARGHCRLYLESLLMEAAFGEFNCSPRLVRELAIEAFEIIETGDRMVHRTDLLEHVLGGLGSTKARDMVKERLRVWFPCLMRWRSSIFEAMEAYPPCSEVIECLWVAMHDEEPSNQLAAARTLAAIGRGEEDLGRRVERIARLSENPLTRAVALEAYTRGWPEAEGIDELIGQARLSGSPALELFAISATVARGRREPADRDELLRLASHWSGLHHYWRDETTRLLVTGWSGDSEAKRACIDSLGQEPKRRPIDRDVAWEILLKGYPQDDDVVNLVLQALEEGRRSIPMLRDRGGWDLLAENFKDNPRLVPAVDRWMQNSGHPEDEVALAALVGRTAVGKTKLLELLGPRSFAYWPTVALLKGWGRDDPEVREAFESAIQLPPAQAARFAHIFPSVIEDKAECRQRLLQLLRAPECRRPDLVLIGLMEIGGGRVDSEVIDILIDEEGQFRRDFGFLVRLQVAYFLIRYGHPDPRVRRLSLHELSSEEPPYNSIIRGLPHDSELRDIILRRMTPLPERLRILIATRLAEESPDATFALEQLGRYRDEEDEEVKVQASISYWRLANDSDAVTPEMIEQLGKDIVCYGMDHDEQRQAAFCGLVTLRRLDLMASARETIGDEKACKIRITGTYRHTNVFLIRFVAQKWANIFDIFGDNVFKSLTQHDDDRLAFWEQLAPIADAFPVIRDAILSFLESRMERIIPAPLLLFLGRVRPRSIILREYCMEALQVGRDNRDASDPKAVLAAELVGRDYGGDPEVLEQILSGRARQEPYVKTILCLCEGWPDHPLLDFAFSHKEWSWGFLPDVAWHRLLCVKGSSEEVSQELLSLCSTPAPILRRSDWTPRPFLRRLQHDDRLKEILLEKLEDQSTPSERTSIPAILASARGLIEKLRTWSESELDRQHALEFPEFGHDILAAEERAVAQSLLDVLAVRESLQVLGRY